METFSVLLIFVRGIHRSPVNFPHKGQWRGALMFSLICAWINAWVKQSLGCWFEKPSRSLWRHCNVSCGCSDTCFGWHNTMLSMIIYSCLHVFVCEYVPTVYRRAADFIMISTPTLAHVVIFVRWLNRFYYISSYRSTCRIHNASGYATYNTEQLVDTAKPICLHFAHLGWVLFANVLLGDDAFVGFTATSQYGK